MAGYLTASENRPGSAFRPWGKVASRSPWIAGRQPLLPGIWNLAGVLCPVEQARFKNTAIREGDEIGVFCGK